MQKKKFDLTADIVELDSNDSDSNFKNEVGVPANAKDKKSKAILLTIAVSEEMRKEFKSWCAQKGLKMNEAFLMGFKLLKERHINK